MRDTRETVHVDIEVHVHAVTPRAVRISLSGVDEEAVWIPRSQIRSQLALERGEDMVIGVADWIAEREGLV